MLSVDTLFMLAVFTVFTASNEGVRDIFQRMSSLNAENRRAVMDDHHGVSVEAMGA